MRKYILSIILILSGLIIVAISYRSKNNPTYSESAFAETGSEI